MTFIKVAEKDRLPSGEGMVVEANGKKIALFNVNGEFYAIENTCPHRGGPLGEGYLDGMVVSCPWHGWQFDVKTGISPVVSTVKAKKFNVKLEGGDVLVEI